MSRIPPAELPAPEAAFARQLRSCLRATILPYLQPGDDVQLIAEPGNPYDEWAVRIEHRKSRIGYLPRSQNQTISRLLQQGAHVECQIISVDPLAASWEAVKIRASIAL